MSPGYAHRDAFEAALLCDATLVDETLYRSFVAALDLFPRPPQIPSLPIDLSAPMLLARWRPSLRFPADLFAWYRGEGDALTTVAKEAAARDLAAIQPPVGLSHEAFISWVKLAILQSTEFKKIDEFIVSSRRFGEMRDLLADRGADDGSRVWQTWMRWMLHFLPDRFAFHTANYSEIVSRRRN